MESGFQQERVRVHFHAMRKHAMAGAMHICLYMYMYVHALLMHARA